MQEAASRRLYASLSKVFNASFYACNHLQKLTKSYSVHEMVSYAAQVSLSVYT